MCDLVLFTHRMGRRLVAGVSALVMLLTSPALAYASPKANGINFLNGMMTCCCLIRSLSPLSCVCILQCSPEPRLPVAQYLVVQYTLMDFSCPRFVSADSEARTRRTCTEWEPASLVCMAGLHVQPAQTCQSRHQKVHCHVTYRPGDHTPQ